MEIFRPDRPIVTLMLRHGDGSAWSLHMSADCLRFVGRYRRLKAFDVDPATLFEEVRRAG